MASRAVAVLIDMVVQLVLMVGGILLLVNFAPISDSAMLVASSILLSVLVMVGYPVIFETASRGRSLGKLALGLRVVSEDGGPERFRQALFRGLAGVVEFWMFYGAPALISSLISQRGKRLGDLFAGTIVISDRAPRDTGEVISMPPPLARWASGLELSQLPEPVAHAARQYLLRWHDLSPRTQHEMGVRIATQMALYVSPAAPAGVPAHAYLSAVLAERRRREHERLTRQNTYTPPSAPHAPSQGAAGYAGAGQVPAPLGPAATYAPPAPAEPKVTPGGFAPPA
ncbi:RDD family protein [Nonomuraea sp. NBC_01738]|uniref:RDD family protein n=1 Tax=Nonomuraea sp. NBC_01738 TaxID=2976003 RepID=UPI002E137F60|nr:RDD family protein [Nonomuraea sp. NBC_01738]